MRIAGLVVLAWAAASVAAQAQTSQGAPAAPSAQNSGTGITGDQGNKNGPGGRPDTVGSNQQNPTAQQQDVSKVKGLPGGKSGPPAKSK